VKHKPGTEAVSGAKKGMLYNNLCTSGDFFFVRIIAAD
jgi:hypothetical protein